MPLKEVLRIETLFPIQSKLSSPRTGTVHLFPGGTSRDLNRIKPPTVT